jgi:hypothetical protein
LKKVLILAYDFPPYVSVGGLRPYSWYKNLKNFGLEPIIITRQWSNSFGNELDYIAPSCSNKIVTEITKLGTIVRSPYYPNIANKILLKYGKNKFVFIRKAISLYFEIFQYLFNIGPKSQVYKAAREYLTNNKVDLIIASGDPFVLFSYAKQLSNEFNLKWVADYRDPWVQDVFNNSNPILKFWSKLNEKFVLEKVKLVMTVSEFVANKISENYKSEIFILPNGYDDENANIASNFEQNSELLTITYAGTIYPWHPIKIFLLTYFKWIERNSDIKIKLQFIGVNDEENIKKILNESAVDANIYFLPKVDNVDLMKKLAESNVLLLFNDYSYLGTKIYDYLAVNRKILFCFTDDLDAKKIKRIYYKVDDSNSPNYKMQEELLIKTNSGLLIENSDQLYSILTKLSDEFSINKRIFCNSTGANNYSRTQRTKELADKIKEILN